MHRYSIIGTALFIIALLIFSGCAIDAVSSSPAPAATAEPTASQTPAPTPPDESYILTKAQSAFAEAFTLDLSMYDTDKDLETIPEMMDSLSMFTGMAEDYQSAVRSAAREAFYAVTELAAMPSFELALPEADWRLMVALCCECKEAPADKLKRNTTADIAYDGKKLSVNVTLAHFETLFENEDDDVRYAALTIFAYTNASYDKTGAFRENDGSYEFPEGYVETVIEPLTKTNQRNNWFNDRSGATRRHMGMDIRAALNREIHSATAGTVVNKGWGDLAGFYVTVLDPYGFYYTYCHMIALSEDVETGDTVSAGDVIGHVGSTGNSDAPHLHLSIITPEHCYINPYPLLLAVRNRMGY